MTLDVRIEVLEELIIHRASFNFKWVNMEDIHYIAIIIESNNSIDKSKELMEDIVASSYKIDRFGTNKIEVLQRYAGAKKLALKTLSDIWVAFQKIDISSSKFFRRHLVNAGHITTNRQKVKIDDVIKYRNLFMAVAPTPKVVDVEDIQGRIDSAKKSLGYDDTVISMQKMRETLENMINGKIVQPKLDDNGNLELDVFGVPKQSVAMIEPNVKEIGAFSKLTDEIKNVIALGDNQSSVTNKDYLENEKKLLEEIHKEEERMKKRTRDFEKKSKDI